MLNIDFYDEAKRCWWAKRTPRERGSWLLGQLWNCTDIIGHICLTPDLPRGRTMARLVRILKNELMESEESGSSAGR